MMRYKDTPFSSLKNLPHVKSPPSFDGGVTRDSSVPAGSLPDVCAFPNDDDADDFSETEKYLNKIPSTMVRSFHVWTVVV